MGENKYYARMEHSWYKRLLTPQWFIIATVALPILVGTFLLMLPCATQSGEWGGALTALFMATSAMCVTGHTVVDPGSFYSHFGQGVLLVLTQVGGLGFMTMAMTFLIIAGRRLSLRNETAITFSMGMRDVPEIKRFLLRTIILSLFLELCGALVMALCLMLNRGFPALTALYHGVFHSICAFCNAGFSLYPDNLVSLRDDRLFLAVAGLLIVLGGIGFLVLSEYYYERRTRRQKHMVLSLHSRIALWGTLILILAGWAAFALLEWNNTLAALAPADRLADALFQSVSARTAGFNVVDMAQTQPGTRFMMMVLMFIGGCPGSTAGGVKITTAVVLVFTSLAMIRNQRNIVIMGRTVSAGVSGAATAVFLISFLAVIGLFGVLLLTEQEGLMAGRFSYDCLLFDTVSAFGTVGLSAGIMPLLSAPGKLVVILLMFIGRVGPLTLALFIGMKDQRELIRYPQEDVIIG